MAGKKKSAPAIARADEALLQEIRDRFDYAMSEWSTIRKEGSTDMQYVAGDPWDENDREQRKGRPTVAPDELHQYYNQVVNDLRANPRGIRFAARGNGANDEGARFYEEKTREIEYRSRASQAYITAAENAIHRSYGYVRLESRYEDERSFNQDLWISECANPDMVLPDPDPVRPIDWRYLFNFELLRTDEFLRQHDDAQIRDFAPFADVAPAWLKGESIIRAEYWTVKETPVTLYQWADGSTALADEERRVEALIAAHGKPIRSRKSSRRQVCSYLTNGVEILETTEWPGKYIPFAACYGKVIYVDGKRQILSMTRAMREPWKLYCYYRSQQAEIAGQVPKAPVQAYEGQMRGHEEKWARARHEPVDFLYFKGKTPATGENILPPPSRIDYNAGQHLEALELCAEGARRAVQAAAGSGFLPTAAQRKTEKSGVALAKIDESAQRGSFHFVDNYNGMIETIGTYAEDVLDKVIDTARDVAVRKADGTAAIVRVNDPQVDKPISTKGSYLPTVSTGPSFDSEREAASGFADTIVTNGGFMELLGPQKGQKFLALVIKLRNVGPLGDQMADIIDPQPKNGPMDPQQAVGMIQAAQQEIQQLRAALAECQQALKTRIAEKRLEIEAKKQIAAAEIEAKKEIAEIQANSGLGAAAIKADSGETLAILEARLEEIRTIVDERMALLDQAHEVGLEAMRQQHERELAAQTAAASTDQQDRAHAQALELGDQQHGFALDQAAQAAALQPEPGAGLEA